MADNASTGLASINTSCLFGRTNVPLNFSAASFHEEGTLINFSSSEQAGAATTTSNANFSNASITERTTSSPSLPSATSTATGNNIDACSPNALENLSTTFPFGARIPTLGRITNSGVVPAYDSASGRSYQNPAPGVANGTYAPQSTMVTGTDGSPPPSPVVAHRSSAARTTSIPDITSPNITCFPSHFGDTASSVTKNCDVLEFFPEFPIERSPARSCFRARPARSSLNFFPKTDSPPDPFPKTKSPPCIMKPLTMRWMREFR
mmetsp:Transcript_36683/g.88393  ORF Transcript_36683/g.88393 Transcript_36683/m.88393 type:complete len:264 (-) Transcript_36683:649-1440(-)